MPLHNLSHHPLPQRAPHYDFYRRDVYSQSGEDGVLSRIFQELTIPIGVFVDVGAGKFADITNTEYLSDQGWSGLLIDSDPKWITYFDARLQRTAGRVPYQIIKVGPDDGHRIDDLIAPRHWANRVNFLNIDIEEASYYAWRDMQIHRPDVVVLEIAGGYEPGQRIAWRTPRWPSEFRHTSWTDAVDLGQEKGYRVVAYVGNAIFVRDDLCHKLSVPKDILDNPDSLWTREWWGDGPVWEARP